MSRVRQHKDHDINLFHGILWVMPHVWRFTCNTSWFLYIPMKSNLEVVRKHIAAIWENSGSNLSAFHRYRQKYRQKCVLHCPNRESTTLCLNEANSENLIRAYINTRYNLQVGQITEINKQSVNPQTTDRNSVYTKRRRILSS